MENRRLLLVLIMGRMGIVLRAVLLVLRLVAGSSDVGDFSAAQSLQDCLDKYIPLQNYVDVRYTSAEHLDRSQYTCSNCSASTGATKQMSIKVLPNVLCLQLKVSHSFLLLMTAFRWSSSKSGRTRSIPNHIRHDSLYIPHNLQ